MQPNINAAAVSGLVADAATRLSAVLTPTPLMRAVSLDGPTTRAWLKLEGFQPTGSFKVRGALNRILGLGPHDGRRVVAASSGNHGAAVAWACRRLGRAATVFVPQHAAEAKLAAIRGLGAEIIAHGSDCVASEQAARAYAADHGLVYVSPYNDVDVIAGQGTVAAEIADQLSGCAAVFVSVGGGGLLAGAASYMRVQGGGTSVFGVSPANSPVLSASLRRGAIVEMESLPTLSDATAGGLEPGAITYSLCRELVAEIDVVTEAEIADGMRRLALGEGVVGEGSAGAAVAGYRKRASELEGDVVVVVCGRNVDARTLAEVIAAA